MSRTERDKGARGANEVLAHVKAAGWPHATLTHRSGADGHSDLDHGPQRVALEIKRTEKLRLRDAWRQVTDDADRRGDLPVIATRWNNGQWLAVLPLDELLALLWLRERG